MELIQEAIKSQNWDAVIEKFEELEEETPEALDLALHQAVINNSPINIIEKLIQKGANFMPETSFFLAATNNLKMTQELVNLGLDLYFVNSLGQNSITSLIIGYGDYDYLEFLLAHNVSIKPSIYGRDPLDHALGKLTQDLKYIHFVEKLIRSGAPIESSHKTLINNLKYSNPNIYFSLTENIPDLKQL